MSAERKGPEIDNKVVVRPWKITPAQAEREAIVDRALARTRGEARKRTVLHEVGREPEYRIDKSFKEYSGLEGETLRIMSEDDSRYADLEVSLEVKANEEIVYYTRAGDTRYAKVKKKALEKIH